MKSKKPLMLVCAFASVLAATIAQITVTSHFKVQGSCKNDTHVGYHYARKEATTSNPGNKEFWACCTCHEQFLEKPEGSFEDSVLTYYLDPTHIAYIPPVTEEKSVTFDKMTLEDTNGKQYFVVVGDYTGDITTDYVYVDLTLTNAGGTLNYGGKAKTKLTLDAVNKKFDARVDISDMISMKTFSYYVPSLVVDNKVIDISVDSGSTAAKYIKTDGDTSQFRLQKYDGAFKLVRQSVVGTIPEGASITGYTGVTMNNIDDRLVVTLSGTSIGHTRTSLCLNIPDFRITRSSVTAMENMASNNVVGVRFDSATGNFDILFDVTDLETHATAYKINVSKTDRDPSHNIGSAIGYEGFKRLAYGSVDVTTIITLNGKKYNFVYRESGYNGDLCVQVKAA